MGNEQKGAVPQQKPKQMAPAKKPPGVSPDVKPRKLQAPSVARESESMESDVTMKADKSTAKANLTGIPKLPPGTIGKSMSFVAKAFSSSQSDEDMGHIGKKKYRKTWSPLKGTKWSEERRAARGGKKWREEHPEGRPLSKSGPDVEHIDGGGTI